MSQELHRDVGFRPLLWVQASGVFHENLFKATLLFLIPYQLTGQQDSASSISSLAALYFITPAFVFSAWAGQFADRLAKHTLIKANKAIEVVIALLGTAALYTNSIAGLLGVSFLLGMQAALFGPCRLAILPQLVQPKNLSRSNGYFISMGLFAMLLGTLSGGILSPINNSWLVAGGICVTVSISGFISALFIPVVEPSNANIPIQWNILHQLRDLYTTARADRNKWIPIVGGAWFWFCGLNYLTQMPTITKYSLKANETVGTVLIALFVTGIGLGCAAGAKMSANKPELGLPANSLFALGAVSLAFAAFCSSMWQLEPAANSLGLSDFLTFKLGIATLLSILLIGVFCGCFALPLYTQLQLATDRTNRAQMMSFSLIINAGVMTLSSLLSSFLLSDFSGPLQLSLNQYLVLIGLCNLGFGVFMFYLLSRPSWRMVAQILLPLRYKILAPNIGNLPETGSAVIVCNHESYLDPLIVMAKCKRHICFLMDMSIYHAPLIHIAFKGAGTLPICSPLQSRKTYFSSIETARERLKAGHLVFIFPEGMITKDGELGHFYKGVERLIEESDVPVIPMSIQGLWGCFFSRTNGLAQPHWTLVRPWRRKVRLNVGQAIHSTKANADKLKQAVIACLKESDRQ